MNNILTKEEALVYFSLIQREKSILALSKDIKIHRPKLYKLLESMEIEGLVIKNIKGKHVLYTTASKEILKNKIEQVRLNIELESKELARRMNQSDNTLQNINNKDDIIKIYSDLAHDLPAQTCYYSLTSSTEAKIIEQYLPTDFRKIREKKNLWSYVLTTSPIDKKKGLRFTLDIKHVNDKEIEKNCLWLSYSDIFVFINFTTETGYKIKDASLARFQQGIIKNLYNLY